jgi:hypothetical protein
LVSPALPRYFWALTRAISRWHPRECESEEHVERVLTSVEDGSFLLDRLGAAGVVDQDLAIVLLALRQRLTKDYGSGPANVMLIDRAVVAYQGFSMVSGWIGNDPPPSKWSTLSYGFCSRGGRDAEEELQAGRDCRQAAAG